MNGRVDSFGEFHKRLRLESGYKRQREYARVTGISGATISRIEANIQRPEPETLAVFAKYLKGASYAELLQKAGYPELYETEVLKPIPIMQEDQVKYKTSSSTAKELIRALDLSDKEIVEKFDILLDGQKLTQDEVLGAIAFLRTRRGMDS